MTWNLNLGGHANTQEEEASIIDKVEAFVRDLGEGVWHSFSTTAFHGAGSVDNLRQNVQPRETDTTPPANQEQADAAAQVGNTGTDVPQTTETTGAVTDMPAGATVTENTDTGTTGTGAGPGGSGPVGPVSGGTI